MRVIVGSALALVGMGMLTGAAFGAKVGPCSTGSSGNCTGANVTVEDL